MKNNLKHILLLLAATWCCYGTQAQAIYKTGGLPGNSMTLSGTSTLHKWNMKAQSFTGESQFGVIGGQLESVKALTFSLPVKNLKGKEKELNKNAYAALKSSQYNNILYKLTLAQVMPSKTGEYVVRTRGNLTIAGVTKEIIMDVLCSINKDASITCTGSEKLKMTDYQVEPPKFMMGAMTTGDEITLDFNIIYKQ